MIKSFSRFLGWSVFLVILAVAGFLLPHAGRSSELVLVTHDGVWWQGLTEDRKLAAVQGMLVGFDAGYTKAQIAAGNAIDVGVDITWTCVKPCPPDGRITPSTRAALRALLKNGRGDHSFGLHNKFIDAMISQKPAFAGRTFGTMVERLNEVYQDRPALAKVAVSIFFVCAAVSGQNCDWEINAYSRH